MTTAMYRHANGKAIKGRRHGHSMATTLRRHGDDMATTLRRHGDDVMTTWRRCGDDDDDDDDDDANGGEATAITTTRGNLPAPSCSITVSPPSWQSVMLSLGVCACVFVNVFSLHDDQYIYYTIYIYTLFAFVGPGVLIILYWAFGLHALHFTTGFCTLCICCCIPDMQTTILFTKACQQTMPIQVRYSQVRQASVHRTAFNAKGWRN